MSEGILTVNIDELFLAWSGYCFDPFPATEGYSS